MSLIKSVFKRWDGTAWNEHYFRTSADIIDETTTYKVMTATERTAISTYLTAFNGANQLLQLDGDGLIPIGLIPGGLDYLTSNNPTFTGTLSSAAGNIVVPNGIWAESQEYTGIDLSQQNIVSIYTDSTETFKVDSVGDIYITGQIKGLQQPTDLNDAVNKNYVDTLISSGTSPKAPVKAASTSSWNVGSPGMTALDGYTLQAGDRILLKNQTTIAENGVYVWNSSSSITKVGDDSTQGTLVFVENGTTNNDTQFYAESDTSWIVFARVDTIGTISNGGLEKVGTNLGIEALGVTNAMLAGSINYNKLLDTAINDNVSGWTNPSLGTAGNAHGLTVWLQSALSAIAMLRGTASYKTNNSETIAGAYDLAEVKNRTYTGGTNPSTTGFVSGDLYFQDIV